MKLSELDRIRVEGRDDRIVMTCMLCEGRLTAHASPDLTLWQLVDAMLDHLDTNHPPLRVVE